MRVAQDTDISTWDLDEAVTAAAAAQTEAVSAPRRHPTESPGYNPNPYAPENIKKRKEQKAAAEYKDRAKQMFQDGVPVKVSLPNRKHADKMHWDRNRLKQVLATEDWEVLVGRVDGGILNDPTNGPTVKVKMPNESLTDWSYMQISIFSLEELTTNEMKSLAGEERKVGENRRRPRNPKPRPPDDPKPRRPEDEKSGWTWKHTLGLIAVCITAPLSGPAIAAGCTAAGVSAATAATVGVGVARVGGGLVAAAIIDDAYE